MSQDEKVYQHVFDEDEDEALEVELPERADWKPPAEDDGPKDDEPPADPVAAPVVEPPVDNYELEALRIQVQKLNEAMQNRDASEARAVMHGATAKLDQEIVAAKAALKAAQESGETDAAIEAIDKLAELRADRKAQTLASEQAPPARPQQQPEKPLTTRWKSANPWFGNPQYAAETVAAHAIDTQMEREGYAANTPAYYEELNKRLGDKFRSIKPGSIMTRPPTTAIAPQAGVRAQPGAPAKKSTVTIDARHREIMRDLGMDPRDPKQAKAYAMSLRDEKSKDAR